MTEGKMELDLDHIERGINTMVMPRESDLRSLLAAARERASLKAENERLRDQLAFSVKAHEVVCREYSTLKSDRDALRRRAEDAELMLRAILPNTAIYGGVKAPEGKWILGCANNLRVPDKDGLPDLDDRARAALRGAQK